MSLLTDSTDILKIATNVSTPIGLLGLVVALGYLAYSLKVNLQKTELEKLPPAQRAIEVDDYLTRYGISGATLPEAQKFSLIKEEMEKRHRRSIVYVFTATAAFVLCFGFSVFVKPPPPVDVCAGEQNAVQAAKATINDPSPGLDAPRSFDATGTAKVIKGCVYLWLAVEVNGSIWPRTEGHLVVDQNNTWTQPFFEDSSAKDITLSLWAAGPSGDSKLSTILTSGRTEFKRLDLEQLGMHRVKSRDLRLAPK
jgi:hypothetical protein